MLNKRFERATGREYLLAIDGGAPAISSEIKKWPRNDLAIKKSLDALFESGEWGRYTGTAVQKLEEHLSSYFVREHAFLCSSGTIAVELALRGANVRAGDEVILAAYDFPGNFRAIEAIGATPVLVDLHPKSWQVDIEQLPRAVSDKTKAILASHLHGELLPMGWLSELARTQQISLIEDACQCPGAFVDGKKAGQWGDASIVSFGGSKLLSAGRGGAVMCNSAGFLQRMQIASDRGNHAFPLSQLQSAVLLPQLELLDERNRVRLANAKKIVEFAGKYPWLKMVAVNDEAGCMPAFYKLPVLLDLHGAGGWYRERIIAVLQAEGVAVDIGFRGFAKRSERRCRKTSDCNQAQDVAENTMLLHHPVLLESDDVIEQVLFAFEKVNLAIEKSI